MIPFWGSHQNHRILAPEIGNESYSAKDELYLYPKRM